MKAVILAAGVGSRLAPLTDDRPKALVEVCGKSFLVRQIELLAAAGIPSRDVVVVGGYRIDRIGDELASRGFDGTIVLNHRYRPWNNFFSVLVAEPVLAGHDFLQLDGDTILDPRVLPRMLETTGEALLAITRHELGDEEMKVELMAGRPGGERPSGERLSGERPSGERMTAISKQLPPASCAGEYIGITRLSAAAARAVFAELAKFPGEGLTNEYYEYAFNRLADRIAFGIVDVTDCTVHEIDTVEDLRRVESEMRANAGSVAAGSVAKGKS